MIPSKLPDGNFIGNGVNMLRDKVNEILEYLRSTEKLEKEEFNQEVSSECPHINFYSMNRKSEGKDVFRCKDCKKFFKK